MAKVMKRHMEEGEYPIDSISTIEEAELLLGEKLDRRRNYLIINNKVCSLSEWTGPCTGCSCDSEYGCSCCGERGAGCKECGYTGKRRTGYWFPVDGSSPV